MRIMREKPPEPRLVLKQRFLFLPHSPNSKLDIEMPKHAKTFKRAQTESKCDQSTASVQSASCTKPCTTLILIDLKLGRNIKSPLIDSRALHFSLSRFGPPRLRLQGSDDHTDNRATQLTFFCLRTFSLALSKLKSSAAKPSQSWIRRSSSACRRR